MISKELLPDSQRENLEAEKWLLNTEFNQAKFFNETGHQFFRDGRYKKYQQATQLDVTKRIVFVLEKIEEEYQKRMEEILEMQNKIEELTETIHQNSSQKY